MPWGGFGAELSSSAGFFGSRSDFFWVSLFGLSLGFIWARVSLSQGGFGEIPLNPVEAVSERMARVSSPRGGFGAELSSSTNFFWFVAAQFSVTFVVFLCSQELHSGVQVLIHVFGNTLSTQLG